MQELLYAGGALVLTGCPGHTGCCNANPDPCCPVEYEGVHPALKPECDMKAACESAGGRWSDPYLVDGGPGDAGVPHCIYGDAGVDAPHDAPRADAPHDAPHD